MARKNCELDRDAIPVFIPKTWKRSDGCKVIVAPGGDACATTKARLDETLIRILAPAHRWERMLEEGKYRSVAGIAQAERSTGDSELGCGG